jgi:hypothetical protein
MTTSMHKRLPAGVYTYQHAHIPISMRKSLQHAYIPTSMRTHLPALVEDNMHAYMPTSMRKSLQHAYIPTSMRAHLPALVEDNMHAYMPTSRRTCIPAFANFLQNLCTQKNVRKSLQECAHAYQHAHTPMNMRS